MALTVEQIQIIVDAQVDQALRGMNQVQRETRSMTLSLGKAAKIIGGAAVTGAIVKAFVTIGKQSLKAASDAEETYNKFSVVFASVADEAEASADRIKDEFKLSDETVQNFLSGVGDITSGLGATSEEALKAADEITRLGLDIDSFANLSGGAEQAVSALTSLFTGEREAAKALGIVINDTNLKAYAEDMGKVFKELTPLEKGFLSLELATKQSELAIGDFSRSSDSYANKAKAAKEATKDLKAALGESLLPVATKSVSIFGDLAAKLAEVVKEENELIAIFDRFKKDEETAQDRVAIVEREIEATQKLYDINLKALTLKQASIITEDDQKQLDFLFKKSSELNIQLRSQQRLLKTLHEEAKAEKEIADAEKARLAEQERRTKLELEASSILDSRRKDRLTDEELLLTNLQQQIDYWAEFRDIVGVQQLLNDLIEERNELLNPSKIEEDKQAWLDNYNEKAEAEYNLRQAIIDREARSLEAAEAEREAWMSTYTAIGGAAISLFNSIGSLSSALGAAELARLEKEGASQEELDAKKRELAIKSAKMQKAAAIMQIAVDTPAAIVSALRAGPIAGPILAGIIGAAAGVQLAAAIATPIPAFAQGGSFLTNGEQNITVGDNAGGVEKVTVEPVSSVGTNQQQGMGENRTMILNINGTQFTGWLQDQLDNGELRIPRRLVV